MFKKRRLIGFLPILLAFFFIQAIQAVARSNADHVVAASQQPEIRLDAPQTVLMVLQPQSMTLCNRYDFELWIQVESGAQETAGASAYLNFDPVMLQALSITITGGCTTCTVPLPTVLTSTLDNQAGNLDITAVALEETSPSGSFTWAQAVFRPYITQTGVTSITFNTLFPRESGLSDHGAWVHDSLQGASLTLSSSGDICPIENRYIPFVFNNVWRMLHTYFPMLIYNP